MLQRSRKSPSLRHQLEEVKKGVKVCGVICDLAWDLLYTTPDFLCTKSWAQICPRSHWPWVFRVTFGYRVWPRSDPGLDPGFTTLGRHTYHTPTHTWLGTWGSRVLSLKLTRWSAIGVSQDFLHPFVQTTKLQGFWRIFRNASLLSISGSIPFPL